MDNGVAGTILIILRFYAESAIRLKQPNKEKAEPSVAVKILGTSPWGQGVENAKEVKVRVYLHGEKFELTDALDAAKIDLDEKVREKLNYAFYEEVFDYWINLETGKIHFDGANGADHDDGFWNNITDN